MNWDLEVSFRLLGLGYFNKCDNNVMNNNCCAKNVSNNEASLTEICVQTKETKLFAKKMFSVYLENENIMFDATDEFRRKNLSVLTQKDIENIEDIKPMLVSEIIYVFKKGMKISKISEANLEQYLRLIFQICTVMNYALIYTGNWLNYDYVNNIYEDEKNSFYIIPNYDKIKLISFKDCTLKDCTFQNLIELLEKLSNIANEGGSVISHLIVILKEVSLNSDYGKIKDSFQHLTTENESFITKYNKRTNAVNLREILSYYLGLVKYILSGWIKNISQNFDQTPYKGQSHRRSSTPYHIIGRRKSKNPSSRSLSQPIGDTAGINSSLQRSNETGYPRMFPQRTGAMHNLSERTDIKIYMIDDEASESQRENIKKQVSTFLSSQNSNVSLTVKFSFTDFFCFQNSDKLFYVYSYKKDNLFELINSKFLYFSPSMNTNFQKVYFFHENKIKMRDFYEDTPNDTIIDTIIDDKSTNIFFGEYFIVEGHLKNTLGEVVALDTLIKDISFDQVLDFFIHYSELIYKFYNTYTYWFFYDYNKNNFYFDGTKIFLIPNYSKTQKKTVIFVNDKNELLEHILSVFETLKPIIDTYFQDTTENYYLKIFSDLLLFIKQTSNNEKYIAGTDLISNVLTNTKLFGKNTFYTHQNFFYWNTFIKIRAIKNKTTSDIDAIKKMTTSDIEAIKKMTLFGVYAIIGVLKEMKKQFLTNKPLMSRKDCDRIMDEIFNIKKLLADIGTKLEESALILKEELENM
jgi:hypothetical protein